MKILAFAGVSGRVLSTKCSSELPLKAPEPRERRLRTSICVSNLGVTVMPDQLTISSAHEAFDETGRLKDPKLQKQAVEIGSKLATVLAKLCA
jgi:hypothetical protein